MEGSFDECRPSPHEGIIDYITRERESIDEESRKLCLEACPVGNLVQRRRLTLSGSPELSRDARNCSAFGAYFIDNAGGRREVTLEKFLEERVVNTP
jgi:hypothetical protein